MNSENLARDLVNFNLLQTFFYMAKRYLSLTLEIKEAASIL